MTRICLQAGHGNYTTGATGATGERDWTMATVPLVADVLRGYGIEVYITDGFGYTDPKVTNTDWDLFLAVHYDADIYNESGGFTDYPDPSVDMATARSKELSQAIASHYFPVTGIKEISRSNANTKYYYMWAHLSDSTPCVLIECGVGWRKPRDYDALRSPEFPKQLAEAIAKALSVPTVDELTQCQKMYVELEKELSEMRDSRNKWRTDYTNLEKKYIDEVRGLREHVESIQETMSVISLERDELANKYVTLSAMKDEYDLYKKDMETKIKVCGDKVIALEKKVSNLKAKNYTVQEALGFLIKAIKGGDKNE
jgi:hypothetical protein